MKKNRETLIWIIMRLKLMLIVIMFSVTALNATIKAQYERLDMKVEGTLIQLFEALEKKTNLKFVFNHEDVKDYTVSCNVKDRNVKDILEVSLADKGLKYEIVNENVVISRLATNTLQQAADNVIKITGTVKDKKGVPLPGVAILLKGTGLGTSTDIDGIYKLEVVNNANLTLVFTFLGMQPIEMKVGGKNVINVIMEEEAKDLDEVVVTGIFNKSRESYTGSVTTITEKELKSYGNRNIVTTLRNIDPSFNMIENNEWGNNPNKLPEIQIRGASSLPDIDQLKDNTRAELNTPLIILDGFEISLQRMVDLDDNEIESITLLKDATATAIYGSRGSNGVIVIQTKEPERGRLKFSYTGSVNVEVPDLSDYDVLNASEKLELERLSGYYDNPRAETDLSLKRIYNQRLSAIDQGVDTYWLSKPLRTGVGQRHNVKIEGGDKSFRYSASLQYNNVEGVMKGSSRDNFNGGINLTYKHEKLTFRNNLQIGLNKAVNSPYGSFSSYVRLNPYWRSHDEKGELIKRFDGSFNYVGDVPNPLYNATINTIDESKYTNITNNFSIEWRPVDGVTARGQFGISKQDGSADDFKPMNHTSFINYSGEDLFRRGSYNYGTNSSVKYDGSLNINLSKVFASTHMVYAGLNADISQQMGQNYTFSVEGFPHESLDFLSSALQYLKDGKPWGSENCTRRIGIVANLSYSYNDKYFADASYRTDGSSQFGANSRFAPFWSCGLGWNIHREEFFKNIDFLDRLKVRASIGETGSTQFQAYQALARYKYYLDDRYEQWMGAQQVALANPDLQWQKTMKKNIGVEINTLKNRLNVILDIYNERTNGLVSSLDLPPSVGYTDYAANVGKVENKGFEVKVTGFILRNTEKRLIWSLTGAISHNKNKIIELSPAMIAANDKLLAEGGSRPSKIWRVGDSQDVIYVVPSLGIDPSTGKELFLKKNGEVSYDWNSSDRVACGLSQPKYRGNLNSMFRIADLSLNLSFSYQWGGQRYNSTLIDRVENVDKKFNCDKRVFNERWKNPGDRTFFKGIKETSSTQMTSRFVQDENVISCQNINVTYDLNNRKWLKNTIGVSTLSIRGNITEPFRFSTVKIERGTIYPFSRQFSLSLSAIF